MSLSDVFGLCFSLCVVFVVGGCFGVLSSGDVFGGACWSSIGLCIGGFC